MRKFSSYGPVDTDLHYYAPRAALIDQAHAHLIGEDPAKSGHYITVWGPRQTGKTWMMQRVLWRLQADDRFDVLKINLEHLKQATDVVAVIADIAREIVKSLQLADYEVRAPQDFYRVFERGVLHKPLILILDEFDALCEEAIAAIAGVFRNVYVRRNDQGNLPSGERDYLLHAVALIGVRAVLGVENPRGSPFNVQRSLHIPNLTADEVRGMYHWYERESGQPLAPEVIERVFYETQGQPGLVSWLGELLTETYNPRPDQPLTMAHFEGVYSAALQVLPNNNILNIISKARQEPYQDLVLELFRTHEPLEFAYDDPRMNFLYLNGVIDWVQTAPNQRYVKFPCPFVQKRFFNYFARTLFRESGQLYPPFADLSDAITDDCLFVPGVLRRYETYLRENRSWLLKDAPRRSDLRVYEAVFHFSLYRYLASFLEGYGGQVVPEFPTGNGQIDLLLRYAGQSYALEVKSYTTAPGYRLALQQAARYGQQLGLAEVTLALFVEAVDDANRAKYEAVHTDATTGVVVRPVFVQTGT
ncbi:MAG TPA: AAA-like domain-containing protein [Anaerolineae bacterium]|nr:AAA-like domain-containing protein [Anaerolineae bacterium]